MNSKRSMWQLFLTGASVGLLVTNCTIKTASDTGSGDDTSSDGCSTGKKKTGCQCSGDLTGYQVCSSDGIYGSCVCPDGTTSIGGASNSGAGASNSGAGTSTDGGATSTDGGATSADGGATSADAGSGGEGGALVIDPTDCGSCLARLCAAQFDACDANPNCISANVDGSGQYERIVACIDKERVNGLVKRDVVRGCGVTIGVSSDPDVISSWAPENMDPATTDLLNCMADAPGAVPASWANDDANYPVGSAPTPWPAGTCAKLACTSQITN
ncbi:MAG: hypothetical protein ABI488_15330 [Polyangiaceae bacterium]